MPILTHEERVGTLLAEKYRLEAILGRGGMGAVFAGVHEWTSRRVAVKLLNYEFASEPEMAERFLREAKTAATLKHPNVVDVLDMGRAPDGTVYLVLERLEGRTLAELITLHKQLTVDEAFDALVPVMRALTWAHKKGVVHRDLKPENIFIADEPSGGTVPKLLDFGIAKVIEAGATKSTRTGAVLGTPEYMSPEQAQGAGDIGPQTDVWSMGVVWYEALTGLVPFEGPSPTAVILRIVEGKFVPLVHRDPSLPTALSLAIDRALAPDRADRYPDMTAFLDALLAARNAVAVAPASTAAERGRASVPETSLRTSDVASRADTELTLSAPVAKASPGSRTERTPVAWSRNEGDASTRSRARLALVGGVVAAAMAAAVFIALHRAPAPAPVTPQIATLGTSGPATRANAPAGRTHEPAARADNPAIGTNGQNVRPNDPAIDTHAPTVAPDAPAVAVQESPPAAHNAAPSSSAHTRNARTRAPAEHANPAPVEHANPAPVEHANPAPAPAPHPTPSARPTPARDPHAPLTDYENP